MLRRMSTHAIFRPPPAAQRAGPRLRAAAAPSARACSARLEQMRGERIEIPLVIGGKDVTTGDQAGRDAARQGARARRRPPGRRRARRSRRSTPPRRRGRTGRAGRGRSAPRCSCARPSCSPGPWRDTLQRRDDARPVEDRAPGRDRRRLRVDRLLPLQRRVHDADLRGAAASRRRASGTGSSTARSRASSSRSRRSTSPRSPANLTTLAGADGQRRRLEAGRHGDALAPTT